MTGRSDPLQIFLLGGDADGNLGDMAIRMVTARRLQALAPEARIIVVSRDADRARAETGADVVPGGIAGLPSRLRAAAGSDLVVCGGGGLFQDDDSLVKMPYWALRLAVTRLLCDRVVGFSLGVGPLRSTLGRWAARLAFATMDRVSVRDPEARRVARPLTTRDVEVVPDPAVALPAASSRKVDAWLREQGVPDDDLPWIGLAPRRHFPPRSRLIPHQIKWRLLPGYRRLGYESDRLADALAEALQSVAEAHGARILLLPSYARRHEADVQMGREVLRRLSTSRAHLLVPDDPVLYKGLTSRLSALVGGRMHPTIFAAAAGTPVVGLSYNPKFEGFFRLLDLRDRVIPVDALIEEQGAERLRQVVEEAMRDDRDLAERTSELEGRMTSFLASLVKPR